METWEAGRLLLHLAIGVLGFWGGWRFAGWLERPKPVKPVDPEAEGRAAARDAWDRERRFARASAAYQAELERLRAADVDRPVGRAS